MNIEYKNNYTVVYCKNSRLDAASAPAFRKTVCEQTGTEPKAVILDLKGIEFMDSSGLGAIISILQSLRTQTPLLLCGAGENIQKKINMTRLDSIFPMYKDVEAAARTVS